MGRDYSLSRVAIWLAFACAPWSAGCTSDGSGGGGEGTAARSATEDSAGDEADASSTGGSGATTTDPPAERDGSLTELVQTDSGPVMGESTEANGVQVRTFRNLPYAAAPTGNNRWKPPQPVQAWTEARDAIEWGNRCPQRESTLTALGEISEDCLVLNVITPAINAGDGLPVMVFFHGGGLTIGTGNSPTYTSTGLPSLGNVVAVTVNSRLGPMGYFSHAALAAESDNDSSGNYGTLDLIESLKWVQRNIAAFGGDPDNVTIFGESGGGTKVISTWASPLSEGLFHRAIVESGSGANSQGANMERATAEEAGAALAAQLGIADDADVLAELRARGYQEILDAASTVNHRSGIAIDGWVLPKSIYEMFRAGEQHDVPLIVGANEGEVTLFAGADGSGGSVPGLAAAMSSVSSQAWVYNFSHVPVGWRTPGCVAFHGLELPYVFGEVEAVKSNTVIFLGGRTCPTDTDPMLGEEDDQTALNSVRLWAQFARTGDPSVPDLIDWPPYTPEGDQYLDIAAELQVKSGVATAGVSP